jgi:DME family drug/metabolite transporter
MQLTPEIIIGTSIGLFTALLWAVSTNIYKSQSNEATPLAITALKMWAALVFMSILVMFTFRTSLLSIPLENTLFLIVSVTIGLIIGDFIYLVSQERIGVSYAFPIANIYPILTYIIAIFLVNDTVIVSRFAGILVAIFGVTLISREHASDNKQNGITKFDALGIGFSIIAAFCWAFGSVFLQIGVTGIDPIDANFIRMFFGGALFIPIFVAARKRGMPQPTRRATKIVLAAGLLGMAIGSLLYTYSVQMIGAPIAALLGSTSPLFAVPISVALLKERLSYKSIIGILLTVLGVVSVIMAV